MLVAINSSLKKCQKIYLCLVVSDSGQKAKDHSTKFCCVKWNFAMANFCYRWSDRSFTLLVLLTFFWSAPTPAESKRGRERSWQPKQKQEGLSLESLSIIKDIMISFFTETESPCFVPQSFSTITKVYKRTKEMRSKPATLRFVEYLRLLRKAVVFFLRLFLFATAKKFHKWDRNKFFLKIPAS